MLNLSNYLSIKKISIDTLNEQYFIFYKVDRAHRFDGTLVKFKGKHIENKSIFLPCDPKHELLVYVHSALDQIEDMDFFEENKTYATKVLMLTIICWIYHFELQDEFLNNSLKQKLEPDIFLIIENIESLEWNTIDYINLFELP